MYDLITDIDPLDLLAIIGVIAAILIALHIDRKDDRMNKANSSDMPNLPLCSTCPHARATGRVQYCGINGRIIMPQDDIASVCPVHQKGERSDRV